ncbi:hypothetical protein BAE44_0023692 [Dichanthelium oligosanthes]|uniref:Uncharacterized protein n=1 Tax=Dichanthelium oligosanthes TaxID=888268 RepID=A0A1E5UR53_9POAL|nr:hypothetical protein BAE44_0023692 [Dichanthelium oligosanthes]
MRLAAARTRAFPNAPPPVELHFCFDQSMKKVLLDKIHGFYLQAISRIPNALLRSRLHRALLKAGHCYGPFDPVANILVNTIWYDTAFPTQQEFEVDMIRAESLAIAESCSLRGLVAFVHALCPEPDELSAPGDLWSLLLHNDCSIDECISSAGLFRESIPAASAAYQAAATTACHPNPSALANFAAVLLPVVEATLKPLLEDKHILTLDDVQTISMALSQNNPPGKPMRQGDDYEIHAICGVNAKIPEDGNFAPMLLFIECSNDCEDVKTAPFLCLVSESSADAGRCFHCEYAGAKIVHPSLGSYRGQSRDFEDMACGKHSLTNEQLIGFGEQGTAFVDALAMEDFVYFDPAYDSDSAEFINWIATRLEEQEEERDEGAWMWMRGGSTP